MKIPTNQNLEACWIPSKQEAANSENCHHKCSRLNVPYNSPNWFGNWVENEPEGCKRRILDNSELTDLFNNLFK